MANLFGLTAQNVEDSNLSVVVRCHRRSVRQDLPVKEAGVARPSRRGSRPQRRARYMCASLHAGRSADCTFGIFEDSGARPRRRQAAPISRLCCHRRKHLRSVTLAATMRSSVALLSGHRGPMRRGPALRATPIIALRSGDRLLDHGQRRSTCSVQVFRWACQLTFVLAAASM